MAARVFRRLPLLCACTVGLLAPGIVSGQTVAEVCGDTPAPAPGLEAGRWLTWAAGDRDVIDVPSSVAERIFGRLGDMLDLFRAVPGLQPPLGVELRPTSMVRSAARDGGRHGIVHSSLIVQVFHPSVQVAGEASASIWVEVNSLTHLFYDAAGPLIEDDTGPIFIEPALVGEVAGHPLYQTRITTCVAVLKAHSEPLWLPVSQERMLRAQIADLRSTAHEADSAVSAGLSEQQEADKEMQEVIRRLRETDPAAAEKLERELAAVKQEVARNLEQTEGGFSKMNESVGTWIGDLEQQLAALSPAERARQAYVTGGGSVLNLLADPSEQGARALVAPNPTFFDLEQDPTAFQLLTVRMRNGADHPPETTIIESVRRGLDWEALRSFLVSGSPR